MIDTPTVHALLVTLSAIGVALAAGQLVRRIGQPPVVGELAAGILLGPSVFDAVAPEMAAHLFTPLAVSLLDRVARAAMLLFMFLIGLELDHGVLRRHARGVARIAAFSLVVPFLLGSLLAFAVYDTRHGDVANRTAFVLFVGTALAITAMPVLARILADLRMLTTTIGTIALGCAAIDDVVAWTMLGLVTGLVRGQANVVATLGSALLYVGGMLLLVRPVMKRVASVRAKPFGQIIWLAFVAGIATLSAVVTEAIGIHAVFGMFLAGVCVPRGGAVLQGFEAPLKRAATLILPAFFVTIGLRTKLTLLHGAADWGLALVILFCATAGKLGASSIAARTVGFAWREALALGALLNTRGLVGLVALEIGRSLGILSPALFAMFVIMTFVTTFGAVPILTLLGHGRRQKAEVRS
jgi:K+:H+ antiporter